MTTPLKLFKVTVQGQLNLANFLPIAPNSTVGFGTIEYTIAVVGDDTAEQFAQ